MTKLYHYTCSHAAEGIARDRLLRPHKQIQLDGRELVWMTDLDTPDRDALGLTSRHLRCDRTEFRATVILPRAGHWPAYVRRLPRDVRLAAREMSGLPMHWWVSELLVPVETIERVA